MDNTEHGKEMRLVYQRPVELLPTKVVEIHLKNVASLCRQITEAISDAIAADQYYQTPVVERWYCLPKPAANDEHVTVEE